MTHVDAVEIPNTRSAAAASIDIPFDKFRLDNGLTVIVHENRRAPVVALNLWYRVGAKEEPAGQTGFAHLFEHLMFNGSANHPGHFISNMNQIGATNLNGTTNRDRTNYYATVPTVALDYALFAESDRMGHFYETINQETLDLQRGVVQNEKREREGKGYGRVFERIVHGTYPVGHPYAHTVLGSMEDLDAATLEDVRNWFKTYYGPSNAVLTLAGDIDVATAREKVKRYFGHIPPGPPLARPRQWIAKMSGIRRETLEDRVPQAQLHMVWNIPQYGDPDIANLNLAASVLTSGMSARLRRRLMHQDLTATAVSADVSAGTLAGQFEITASIAAGVGIRKVEQAIEEEVARLIADGPAAEEIERARSRRAAAFVRRLDNLTGIADLLSMNEARMGRPDFYRTDLMRQREATPASVQAAAAKWLSDGLYSLHVVSFQGNRPSEKNIDRSSPPAVGEPGGIRLPQIHRHKLSNGLRIVLAERHELPLVRINLHLESGATADPAGHSGIAQLTTALLSVGAGARDAMQFAEAKQEMGAELGADASLERITATLSAMKDRLDDSLALFADMILRPRFDPAEFERERTRAVMRVRHEKSSRTMSRAMPALLLPAGHPYARPSSGLKSHVSAVTCEAAIEFHQAQFRPQLATLTIVGDTTMEEIMPMLERHFGLWEPSAAAPIAIPLAARPAGPSVYLIDKPGAQQSYIRAYTVLDPLPLLDEFPVYALNKVLAGSFGSRMNMNLREDKHWTYGVSTRWERCRGPNFYSVRAGVQLDRTADSLLEMRRELQNIIGPRPVTADELRSWLSISLLSLTNETASLAGLADVVDTSVRRNLPDDYWPTYADRLRAVTLDQVAEAAQRFADPSRMVWMIDSEVGKFEHELRDLDCGPIETAPGDIDTLYPATL